MSEEQAEEEEEEEEQEEEEADTEVKTKTPHVNVGKKHHVRGSFGRSAIILCDRRNGFFACQK